MIAVDLQVACDNTSLPTQEQLTQWVETALQGLKNDAELSIRIVTIEESQQLNSDYRDKDKPTNVLSFPFEIPPELEGVSDMENLIGDLVICANVVESEAKLQNKPLMNHWAHMVVHGTLHLLGYDHINEDDALIMEDLEREKLSKLDISDPYLVNDWYGGNPEHIPLTQKLRSWKSDRKKLFSAG